MLTDNQIRRLIQDDVVNITPSPEENQFQPASLDWRIGAVEIFDNKTISSNVLKNNIHNKAFLKNLKGKKWLDFIESQHIFADNCDKNIRPLNKDESFIIEPGQQADIYSFEQFKIPEGLFLLSELRSSNGRRGLSPVDGYTQNLLYEGRVKMSVVNKNPNSLKFYRGDRFAQLFFEVTDKFRYIPMNSLTGIDDYSLLNRYNTSFDSVAITSEDIPSAQLMGKEGINDLISKGLLEVSPEVKIHNNQIVFTCSDTASSFKKNFGIIDTYEDYDDNVLYDKIDLSRGHMLKGDDLLVVKLEQYLKLSNHVGILLKLSHPLNDNYQHKDEAHSYSVNDNYLFNHKVGAGWIDPGYEGQVTMHDWTNLINLLREGDVVMTGTVYYFPEPVGNSYGSGKLGSHYVNNSITASV